MAHYRTIDHGRGQTLVHHSVKDRWDRAANYQPKNLKAFVEKNGWDGFIER